MTYMYYRNESFVFVVNASESFHGVVPQAPRP